MNLNREKFLAALKSGADALHAQIAQNEREASILGGADKRPAAALARALRAARALGAADALDAVAAAWRAAE